MSAPGQIRKSARLNSMSVLPPTADVVGPPRHVGIVPQADHTAGPPADTEYASSPPITIDRAAALSRDCRLVGSVEVDTIYLFRDRGGCHARSTKRH